MKKTQRIWHHILVSSVFALYIVILVAILFRSRLETRTIKFVPFGTIFDFLTREKVSYFFIITNLLGNVVLFMPLGIYFALFSHGKNEYRNVFFVFVMSLLAEIIQVTFKWGVGDVDDIILNTLGGYLGVVSYRFLLSKFEEDKVRKIVEIVALVGGIIGLPAFLLYRNLI